MKPIPGTAGNFAYPAVFLSKAPEIKNNSLFHAKVYN